MSGPRVAIIGGGLAGLAAATALADGSFHVELFEARRCLGGRAASFHEPAVQQLVDHCQHVSMGCCTNLADFCRRVGVDKLLRRDRVLHFIVPDGRQFDLAPSRLLPAPLHLAPGLLRLRFLSLRDRLRIARGVLRLARTPVGEFDGQSIGQWLRDDGQSHEAVSRFWSVIFVSALGETVERASVDAARKVLVDGFLASRYACELVVPAAPLGELYGERLRAWLADRRVAVHLGSPVRQIEGSADAVRGITLHDGMQREFDFVVAAVTWRQIAALVAPAMRPALAWLCEVERMEGSPITGVHLWFDRPITPLPHAVLVDRLSQWVFHRPGAGDEAASGDTYYQVVISASRSVDGLSRDALVDRVRDELTAIWPAAREARLLRARVVTQTGAVFSPSPRVEQIRPTQATSVRGLMVAGDWTKTHWPATMESAVRSGYLAAEAIWCAHGQPRRLLAPDLPRGWLARLLLRTNPSG